MDARDVERDTEAPTLMAASPSVLLQERHLEVSFYSNQPPQVRIGNNPLLVARFSLRDPETRGESREFFAPNHGDLKLELRDLSITIERWAQTDHSMILISSAGVGNVIDLQNLKNVAESAAHASLQALLDALRVTLESDVLDDQGGIRRFQLVCFTNTNRRRESFVSHEEPIEFTLSIKKTGASRMKPNTCDLTSTKRKLGELVELLQTRNGEVVHWVGVSQENNELAFQAAKLLLNVKDYVFFNEMRLDDAAFSTSSCLSADYDKRGCRLKTDVLGHHGAWAAKSTDGKGEWIQVNLPTVKSIVGVAIEGRKRRRLDLPQFVTAFKVCLLDDAGTPVWQSWTLAGNGKCGQVVRHFFPPGLRAKSVKLFDITTRGHCSLRWDVMCFD